MSTIIALNSNVSTMLAWANELPGEAAVISVGSPDLPMAHADVALGEGVPEEAVAAGLAAHVDTTGFVFLPATPAGRVFAGAIAAAAGLPVVTGAKGVRDGKVLAARFGGIVEEEIGAPAVVLVSGGAPVEGEPVAGDPLAADAADLRVSATESAETKSVNLGAAKKIVAVGRGFKNEDDLKLAFDLASKMGAEVACSRPIAEGNNWLGRDRYVGVSGQHVTPDLYLAAGISGQIQHTAGMNEAKTVVVVNSDKNAPYFEQADYGIVGDLYSVLPALTEAL
ncbi:MULTISPECIES: electron transfer flavoprotein subunit alpha/FixB family protein [Trueperella]|uniref:Electron transfer flavoprotein subunit alpha n=1 Tax=Trueperella bernardiae TaxID=59561 RepID=A0A0W1KIB6_9ACTO|nr:MULTISPECIES: electron transfer flavoprotein subunit alpha/FixB family protein [Trueperella]KTF03764.1 Electron transfer flavoprotein subunit alpha [Trueperella bernardiae]MCM3907424.1 electron transfer flavoprotein subunit alpha/FixB family protein [Trueperella bernardiae]MDK8601596.1 electron transfer flavoprotein subunit alpha/FixB family protein [Trueperella bernardiae]MDV6238676.1 electron transfer flavoprotein subunit alpha/FixB family protein [Trueperella bernardiae]OFS68780.1 hypoth